MSYSTPSPYYGISIHDEPRPSTTKEEYNDSFYEGFKDGKRSQGIITYPLPAPRSKDSYPVTKMEAYRQGFNLALMESMMDLRMVESSPKWFRWYCARKQDEV